jgi:ABC-type Fe3+/spermidine/putrescine transport system ATPase subunit
MPAEPVLEVRDLAVGYGGAVVLRGVSLTLAPGEVLALLGPSGSGKSTLLHAVAGFVEPAGGMIRLGGSTVAEAGRMVPPEGRSVGVVFQDHALWPHLSALETVAYPARRRGAGRAQARAEAAALLELLGIAGLAGRRPAELSGGEQQRVGLARALARRAAVYLLDEPTAHLDIQLRGLFLQQVATLRREQGAAAVYATHDPEEALGLADRVALLRDGRLVQVGPPEEVYERPVDAVAARLTGPASVLDADGGPVLVRPGWARLNGPLPGRLREVWFRGPHSDHLVATAMGDLLIREPGAPCGVPGDDVSWSLLRSWPLRTAEEVVRSAEDAGDH